MLGSPAPEDKQVTIDICAEMLHERKDTPGVPGANLVTFGDADSVARSVEISGSRG
jgi:hypothetical protein